MNAAGPRLHLVGAIHNFVAPSAASPIDVAMQSGLVFVAMDARAYADFGGGRLLAEWVVARDVKMDRRALEPWPVIDGRHDNQAAARAAYQVLRTHALQRLTGVQVRDDRGVSRRLNQPSAAL